MSDSQDKQTNSSEARDRLADYANLRTPDGKPVFPHLPQVAGKVAVYLNCGIEDVSEAYQMACFATPEIATQIRRRWRQEDIDRARQHAEAARRSSGRSIPCEEVDSEPEAKSSQRMGAPPKYDWERLPYEVMMIADSESLPAKQEALAEKLRSLLSTADGSKPALSAVNERVSEIYARLRKLGWSPKSSKK